MQVPVRHVAAGVAQDGYVLKQPGRQVHPFLVNKQAGPALTEAQCETALVPPCQHPVRLSASSKGNEAEVVGAVVEVILLARRKVIGQRRREMRRQHRNGAAR